MMTTVADRRERVAARLLIAAGVGLIVSISILAAVPPVDRDALTHHLAVPKLYLQHGGMVEIPWIPFSYYPMNLDLLYMLPLYFGQDIAAKYIHFGFALLTAAAIYGYLRRRTGSMAWALLGGLLFLSLPVIVKLSITVYVDLGLIYFSTASLLLLLCWAGEGGRRRHLVAAGVLCGLAMGTKYNGLLTFFLLSCFVPLVDMRRADSPASLDGEAAGSRKALRAVSAGVLFASVALAVFSPWMVRNALWTGNPVYPLYDGLFRPTAATPPVAGSDAAGAEGDGGGGGMNHLAARRVVYGESFLETVTTPLRIFFQGQDDNPKYFDGRLNPCLLLLPPAVFIGTRKRTRRLRGEHALLAAFAGLYLVFAFVQTDMRIRYVAPILGPLVILSVLGLRNLLELARSRLSSGASAGLAAAAAVLILLPNMGYIFDLFAKVQPIDYLAGRVSRDEYIQRHRPEYAAFRYANQQLPADAKVLGVFLGNRRYYCDRTLIFDGTLEVAVKTAGSARDVAAWVHEKGFSHIVIGVGRFEHFVLRPLPPSASAVFQTFLEEHTRVLFGRDGHYLLELTDPA